MSERIREREPSAPRRDVPAARAPEPTPSGSTNRLPTQAGADRAERLWRRFRDARDERAREGLILHYAGLVSEVAGRVSVGLPANVDVGDCTSYGMFGLIDAIEKFDPDRGVRFEPYAMSRIRGAILDELRALDWIPRSVRAKARAIERAYAALETRLHRSPTETELAAELQMEPAELHQAFSQLSVINVLALDELLAAADDRPGAMSLGETLPDVDAADPVAVIESQETRRLLLAALDELPERERRVIQLYYADGLTLAQAGRQLGVSESRVCQIHAKAMVALRTKLAGARH